MRGVRRVSLTEPINPEALSDAVRKRCVEELPFGLFPPAWRIRPHLTDLSIFASSRCECSEKHPTFNLSWNASTLSLKV